MRLFFVFLSVLLFSVPAFAAIMYNDTLQFSVALPDSWQKKLETPFVVEGQEFQAAYWPHGDLAHCAQRVLVRSVETGKVLASDMVGLNKIALHATINSMASVSNPEIVLRNFYPEKGLFAYSIESGTGSERILTNKYVYYTERGALEFTMLCPAQDSETMSSVNIALRSVNLFPGLRYVHEDTAQVSLAALIIPDGNGVGLLPAGFLLAMVVLGYGFFRSR